MDKKFKNLLKLNGQPHLIKELENIKDGEAKLITKGIKLVYDNWDCAPNGGILDHIINYLNSRETKYLEDSATITGTIFMKDEKWFLKWSDITFCHMNDEDYMYTPINIENEPNLNNIKHNMIAKCILKTVGYDEKTYFPIKMAYLKEILY